MVFTILFNENLCFSLLAPILEALTTCPNPSWVADGYCDDRNNGAHCDYDGGDCCFKQEINDTFCQKCLCHEGR